MPRLLTVNVSFLECGGTNYVKQTNLTLVLNAGDTGGSNLVSYELSDDGNSWGTPRAINTSSFSDSSTETWNIPDTEGDYTKYVRFTDGAGNYNTDPQTNHATAWS